MALLLFCTPMAAQAQNEDLDISAEPLCFQVRNEAEFTVIGTVSTDFYTRPDGIRTRHRSNFRFSPAGSIDETTGEPSDRKTFCASGPFFPGRKMELKLKTLIPVFTCKTRVDQGEIIITGRRRADDDGVDMIAYCFD